MKALIGPKIDEQAPHDQELAWLFEEETSLDQIVSRLVIPICIAADFPYTAETTERTEEYLATVQAELEATKAYLQERIPTRISFVVIFVPMDSKSKLEKAINEHVKAYLS